VTVVHPGVIANPAGPSTEMVDFVLQLSIIIIAAQTGGLLVQKYLRLPRIVGEVFAGILIGPYALGGLDWGWFGVLFTPAADSFPISAPLYGVATLASILLLFFAGLETDIAKFLRYSGAGLTVGVFGASISFLAGSACAVACGMSTTLLEPEALFLGTLCTATSIGITARILMEKQKTSSPEGVTIMAAAVFDDVLGIILLAAVVALSAATRPGDTIAWSQFGLVALKSLGVWILCFAITMISAKRLSLLLKISHRPAAIASLALGIALLLAGVMEKAGLAMIIGAYVAGLALSRTDLADYLRDQLQVTYQLLVPVFFCVTGMLVDFRTLPEVWQFGLLFAGVAITAKVAGCGLPALIFRFNARGALRIGIGMMARGEVTLVIATMGMSLEIIDSETFGGAVMMTLLTMIIAPPLLMFAFRGGSGIPEKDAQIREPGTPIVIELPSGATAEFLASHVLDAFRAEEFFVHSLRTDPPSWHLRKDSMAFTLVRHGSEVTLTVPPDHEEYGRMILLEEVLGLDDLLQTARQMKNLSELEHEIAAGIFNEESPPGESR